MGCCCPRIVQVSPCRRRRARPANIHRGMLVAIVAARCRPAPLADGSTTEVPMTRAELTEKIAMLKRKKRLSWRDIAAKIGAGSPIYYTAALHGQMKLSKTE